MRKLLTYSLAAMLLFTCVVPCNAISPEGSLQAAASSFAAMAEMLANLGGMQNSGGNSSVEAPEQTAASAAPVEAVQYQSGNICYIILDDGTIEITKYTGNETNVVISSAYDGRNVGRIGESAFEGCTAADSIVMWANVSEIGKSAFKGCTGLKSFSIPGTVKVIDDSAFEDCTGLESVAMWGNITSIGRDAFRNCTSLKSVGIPGSCVTIGESSFEGCSSLESLALWGGKSIGASAFKDCVSLKSVSIPSVITEIGDYAFAGCQELENAIVWGKNVAFGENTFADCPKLAKLPEGAGKNSTPENTTGTAGTAGGIRPEFKKAMDAYENFYTEYCALLAEYQKNPANLSLLTRYYQLAARVGEIDEAFDAWDESDMSTEELKYYMEVNNRVMQMLVGMIGRTEG